MPADDKTLSGERPDLREIGAYTIESIPDERIRP